MIPNALKNMTTYAFMLRDKPEQTTFFIYRVFCLVCHCFAFFNARRAYREQQLQDVSAPAENQATPDKPDGL